MDSEINSDEEIFPEQVQKIKVEKKLSQAQINQRANARKSKKIKNTKKNDDFFFSEQLFNSDNYNWLSRISGVLLHEASRELADYSKTIIGDQKGEFECVGSDSGTNRGNYNQKYSSSGTKRSREGSHKGGRGGEGSICRSAEEIIYSVGRRTYQFNVWIMKMNITLIPLLVNVAIVKIILFN